MRHSFVKTIIVPQKRRRRPVATLKIAIFSSRGPNAAGYLPLLNWDTCGRDASTPARSITFILWTALRYAELNPLRAGMVEGFAMKVVQCGPALWRGPRSRHGWSWMRSNSAGRLPTGFVTLPPEKRRRSRPHYAGYPHRKAAGNRHICRPVGALHRAPARRTKKGPPPSLGPASAQPQIAFRGLIRIGGQFRPCLNRFENSRCSASCSSGKASRHSSAVRQRGQV